MVTFEPIDTETVAEYSNGFTVTRDTDTGTFYASPQAADGQQFVEMAEFDTERQARLWVDVQTVTGGFSTRSVGDRGVPPEVATAARRVTVAYLVAQGFSTDAIARLCDTKPESIHSYTSRVRSDAAELRE